MEDFLLKQRILKYEGWQVGLVAIFVVLAMIGFGALVNKATTNYGDAGLISKAALKVARLPADAETVIKEIVAPQHPDLARQQRFEGEAGFHIAQPESSQEGLLILARFDADIGHSVTEIVDPTDGQVLHQYWPDISALRTDLKAGERAAESKDPNLNIDQTHRRNEYGMYHPYVGSDGSVIFKDFHTPLVKIDACSRIDWTIYGAFHHALETDASGDFWTTVRVSPPELANMGPDFEEDAIIKVSAQGEVLFKKSISQILLDNDLNYLVYQGYPYDADPFHLNDIQPVLQDGPHWQEGDLFLSLRNRSMIMLYRPSTNKIIWRQQGPWLMQHDVDIMNDHQISVFSNNAASGYHRMFVIGSNNVILFDFDTQTSTAPYTETFERHDIKTVIQGLSEILPNGDIFVEEQDAGRLLMLDDKGDTKWSYVNRGRDGKVYQLHWSRYIVGDQAATLRQNFEEGYSCEP